MKELRLWIAAVVAAAGLASCSSAYYAASGYAGDDLYVQHDRAQIARKQQAEAEAKKAEAEDVLKKLLASGVSADEILEKLK